jgi:hypothetical protein
MSDHLAEVADSLGELPAGMELGVLLATDTGADLAAPVQRVTPELVKALGRRIRATPCEGGRSNLPALLEAWDLAAASDSSLLVWVHGPIRELTDAPEPFLERWKEVAKKPRFLDLQTEPGPNRLLERLGAAKDVEFVTRRLSLSHDLGRLFSASQQTPVETVLVRESGAHKPSSASPAKGATARAMTCLWANDEVSRLLRAEVPDNDSALSLARKYNIVTPVSGAVVLETDEQYARAGLVSVPPVKAASPASPHGVFVPSLLSTGLSSSGSEIGFDLRSTWNQSGSPYEGLILFPVAIFLVARLLLGGPMIRIPFEHVKR